MPISVFTPARPPDFTFRWPVPTRALSQTGDAYNFGQALHTPNFSQVISNYPAASGTPVLQPPRALTDINEGIEMALPYTAQPVGPFLSPTWPDLYFERLLVRAEVTHLGSANAIDGFGLSLSDGSVLPFSLTPSALTGLGGLWFRRPPVVFQWECERYDAAGVLTGSTPFQVGPSGSPALIEIDIRAGVNPVQPTAQVRAGGSSVLDVGTFTFGVDMPSFAAGAWFLSLLQTAATAAFVSTRGVVHTWFPAP